jgi:hypothetical protein
MWNNFVGIKFTYHKCFLIGGFLGVINYGNCDGTNVPHPELGIDQPSLGVSCGITPPLEYHGGELGGLFPPLLPLAKTFVIFCCVMVDVYMLIETCIVIGIWVVCLNGSTPSNIRYIIKFHNNISTLVIGFVFISIIGVPIGKT